MAVKIYARNLVVHFRDNTNTAGKLDVAQEYVLRMRVRLVPQGQMLKIAIRPQVLLHWSKEHC